ncbi:MAG TPA: hypothetical protein VIL00_13855 [Pseudonocardiaceae bacterium]
MTWQDELRRLDEELAAGRLGPEEYRQRRDQLMAANSGAPGTSQQQPGGPFPPPFRWDAAPPSNTDATQVVSSAQTASPDATQVVSSPGGGGDAERTQVVRPVQPSTPPGGQPFPPHMMPGQPNPGGWPQYTDPNAQNWGNPDLPSLDPGWARQGPEVFEEDTSSGKGKIIGIVVGVVLLVGLGVGAFFLFGNKDDSNQNQAQEPQAPASSAPATTTSQKPPRDERLGELPGKPEAMTEKIKTFADVEALNYLTPEEFAAYKDNGAADTAFAYHRDGENTIIVLVTQVDDPEAAAAARDKLHELQLSYGLAESTPQKGVLGATSDTAQPMPFLRRAHYVSGDYVVRVEVSGADQGEVDELFKDALKEQTRALKAND